MARYRHGRRDFFLHGVIVALAAVTSSIWLARDQVEQIERSMPRPRFSLNSLVSAFRPAPRPYVRPVETLEPEPVPFEEPPALAVTAPDVEPEPPAPPPPAQAEAEPASSGDQAQEEAPPSPPPAPTPAPPPPAVTARVIQTAFLRTSPTTTALITGSLPVGSTVTVVGCSAGCTWLLVQSPGGGQAWSSANWFSVQGSLAGVSNR